MTKVTEGKVNKVLKLKQKMKGSDQSERMSFFLNMDETAGGKK